MLAQVRAIVAGTEKITTNLIRSVARDSLQTAQPFLRALRKGDYSSLPNFEDIIQPLDYVRLAEREQEKLKIELVKTIAPEVVETPVTTTTPKRKKPQKEVTKGGLLDVWTKRGKRSGYLALKEAGYIEEAA